MTRRLTDQQWARINQIDGWYHRAEANLLYRHAASPWCEIGCWKGRSTRVLALTGTGYAIDHFTGSTEHPAGTNTLHEFLTNTKGLPVWTRIGDYRTAAPDVPTGLRLLHLDGEHTYDATAEAFALYAPKVTPGGVVVIHDAKGEGGQHPWPGVTRFVRDLARDPDWERLRGAQRSAAFRRRP